MYDINLKNVKKGKNIFYIFLGIGILLFLILGGIFVSNIIKLNNFDSRILTKAIEVKSYIDDEGTTMYTPIYYYNVNGQQYSCSSNYSSTNYIVTGRKTVYYDSTNPSNCMTEDSKSTNYILLIFLLLPIVFIIVAIIGFIKINKRVKIINQLNQTGKLVKNLPYRLENTGTVINNIPIQRPVIDYTLSTGNTITLYGDPRNDRKNSDADGMVDLLIDENNPDNYYIDFEINRLSGNLPQDYYVQKSQSDSVN